MIIRENRRETIKSNSWKLSLHVRPTFSSLLYIHIGFVQFFALNKREKFVPRANVHPVEMEVFSKKRKTNMFRMQHPATVYIFPLLALFRRYSIRPAGQPVWNAFIFGDGTFTADIYSNSISRSGWSHGELAKYPTGEEQAGWPNLRKEIFVRRDEETLDARTRSKVKRYFSEGRSGNLLVADNFRNKINFLNKFWQRFNLQLSKLWADVTILSSLLDRFTPLGQKSSLEKRGGCAYTRINPRE